MGANKNFELNYEIAPESVDNNLDKRIQKIVSIDKEAIIRIGVKIAAEAATEQTRRSKINSPLSIEETIFSMHYQSEEK